MPSVSAAKAAGGHGHDHQWARARVGLRLFQLREAVAQLIAKVSAFVLGREAAKNSLFALAGQGLRSER